MNPLLQSIIHYFLHFIFIGALAWWYDRENWKRNWLILLMTMLVDLDHLFADPIFEAGRCSIGFHYLHSEYVIPLYFLGVIFLRKSLLKLICIGLSFHMFTDALDCFWMYWECQNCRISDIFSHF